MKKSFLTLVLSIVFLSVAAQNVSISPKQVENNRREMERIIKSGDFYYGIGNHHDTLQIAINHAVAELASKIYTDVKMETKTDIDIETKGKQISETTKFEQTATTSTTLTLKGYETLVVAVPDRKNTQYTVFVYIENQKADEIYAEHQKQVRAEEEERQKKLVDDINFYNKEGDKALRDYRIGDALKNWYWAYTMSLGKDVTINGQPADRSIETKIDQTLDKIQVSAVSMEKEKINNYQEKYNLILDIRYKDSSGLHKVTNLDYDYFDGYGWQPICTRANDGVTTLDLHYELDEVDFKCVYRYGQNETPPDVYEQIQGKKMKEFPSADKKIKLTKKAKRNQDVTVNPGALEIPVQAKQGTATSAKVNAERDHREMQRRMERIEKAIRDKDYTSVRNLFTDDGYTCFQKLVATGNASIIGTPQYFFIDYGNITLCRSIPMVFRFRNNKNFNENVTFRFNADNLVESLAFQLSEVTEGSILLEPEWEYNSRLLLMTFLEDYQTAYALKRVEYLDTIFSEKALIILGYKVESRVLSDGVKLKGSVRYDTLSKSDYISRLKRQFKTKEFINLNFTDTEVRRASDDEEVYGIRLRQEYFSSDYGDVGYLFLYVDLRHELPIIHVRAWQNDKLPLSELIKLNDFY